MNPTTITIPIPPPGEFTAICTLRSGDDVVIGYNDVHPDCTPPTRDPSSRTRIGDLPPAAQRAAAIAQGEAFDHDQA